jgi:membrane dipeptidase
MDLHKPSRVLDAPIAELPNVVDGMLKRNYSPARITKLLGGNFIRVLKEVWK